MFFRIVRHQRLQLRQHPLHENARLDNALAHALAHVGDGSVHPLAEALGPADEVPEILRRLERMHALARAHLGECECGTAELVNRQKGKNLLRALAADREVPLQSVVTELVGGRQRGAVKLRERAEIFVAHGRNFRAIFRADVVGPDTFVTGVVVAVEGGINGKQGEVVLVIVPEHRVKG